MSIYPKLIGLVGLVGILSSSALAEQVPSNALDLNKSIEAPVSLDSKDLKADDPAKMPGLPSASDDPALGVIPQAPQDQAGQNLVMDSDPKDEAKVAGIESVSKGRRDSIVGGVAIFVNGEPITLYAIAKAQKMLNTDRVRATDFLIMEKLREYEIKRMRLEVNDAQLDSQIEQIAQQNNFKVDELYAAVVKEGLSVSEYRSKLREQMLMQEFMRKVLFSSSVGQEDSLRKYYNENKEEFMIPKAINAIKLVSKNKHNLESFIKAGIESKLPDSIAKAEEKLDLDSLPPQVADVFLATPKGDFTPVLDSGKDGFVAFYIADKLDTNLVDFDKAKGYIAQKLMMTNQEKILGDYFERVRARSKIVFVR